MALAPSSAWPEVARKRGLCGLVGVAACIDPFGCSRASGGLPCASPVFGAGAAAWRGSEIFLSPSLGSAKEDIPRNTSCRIGSGLGCRGMVHYARVLGVRPPGAPAQALLPGL